MDQLLISLFGPPRIEVGGQQIEINRRKAIALISYLAATEQSHSRDALATLLWPEASQRRAKAGLRSVLWTLNKSPLQKWLCIDVETVSLQFDIAVEIDVVRFRKLLVSPQQHNHPASEICSICLQSLTEAVALYQNDFMAGFTLPDAPAFDEWQFFQADGLRQKLAAALESLIQFHAAAGNVKRALAYGRRHVALDPLHEPAHRALMKLYAQSGQRAAALRQYQVCLETLEAELGIQPSDETTTLDKQIRNGAWGEHENSQTKTVNPNNLPPNPHPFIGRESELSAIAQFLEEADTRLVTIVGAGGVGKTRLALAAATMEINKTNFPDGIYFISLIPLSEPEALISAIAETVGYPLQSDQRSPQQQLFDYFCHKRLLLVLDNFEHLLVSRTFVADLLRHAPQVKIVATSRERLNLYEEQWLPLRGLAVPKKQPVSEIAEYEAAVLFLQSVRRRQPDFEVTTADLPYLAEICQLVEGLPLGLELAATWTAMLSLPEIAAEIQQNLDFLETDMHNVPDRHRSMRAVFDTTWQSLSPTEQEVYARLSLFHGGFTAEGARAVAGASLKTLSTFIGKSLLRFEPRRRRYESHELLRQFAAEKVTDSEEVRQRHARYICAFLYERESDLKGPRQQAALAAIEQELENARAAWQWAAAHKQTDYLAQALEPLCLFYQWHKRFGEGETLCDTALAAILPDSLAGTAPPPAQAHLSARLLTWQGVFQLTTQRLNRARQTFQQAQALLDDIDLPQQQIAAARAFLLLRVSRISMVNDFDGQALALNEESVALYRAIGDEWGTALALDALGQIYTNLGDFDKAFQLQDECLAIRERLGDQLGIARSYRLLGLLVLHTNQLSRSEAYLQQSLTLSRSLGNRVDLLDTLAVLGINQLFSGRFEACLESFAECWDIHEELGLVHEPFTANVTTARALVNLGRYEEVRQLTRQTLPGYRQSNDLFYIAFSLLNLGRVALAAGDVSGALAYLQESNGLLEGMGERSLRPDVPFCLGYAYRARQDLPRAIQAMREGLDIAIETRPLNPMRFELPLMALLSIDKGEVERAVELYAVARQSPYIAHSRWFEDVAGREIEAAASTLPPEAVTAARQRGRDHDLEELALALRVELGE